MSKFNIGDLVARKSYGKDVYFAVKDIIYRRRMSPLYILKGVIHRLLADSTAGDLEGLSTEEVEDTKARFLRSASIHPARSSFPGFFLFQPRRGIPGTVLHLDGDQSFMEMCLKQYDDAKINAVGKAIAEREQPFAVRELLEKHRPGILVLTGHDSIKNKNLEKDSISNYSNSRYFIQSAEIAREYESNKNRLCVFAGACQSYYERIIESGANFASSPGRILINALDPLSVKKTQIHTILMLPGVKVICLIKSFATLCFSRTDK